MKNTLLLLFFAIAFAACNKQPIANFVTDKETYYAGETVHLGNLSDNGKTYLWTFPDGTTASTIDADYTIATSDIGGDEIFQLEAFSRNGKKISTASKKITVSQAIFSNDFFSIDGVINKPIRKFSSINNNGHWYISAPSRKQTVVTGDSYYIGLGIDLPENPSQTSYTTYFIQPNSNAISMNMARIGITLSAEPDGSAWCFADSGQLNITRLSNGMVQYVFNNVAAHNQGYGYNPSLKVHISGNITSY